jgi:hypothetical protein
LLKEFQLLFDCHSHSLFSSKWELKKVSSSTAMNSDLERTAGQNTKPTISIFLLIHTIQLVSDILAIQYRTSI